MKKRVLSLFMALMLCMTLLPTAAFAEESSAADGESAPDEAVAAVQAQITGADCFEALFGWFNRQVAPLANENETATIHPDGMDKDGNIITDFSFSRTGPVYKGSSGDASLSGQYYIIQGDVTVQGNLTVDGKKDGGLVLCDGATLTVEGALIHTGGNAFYIYGQTLQTNSQGTGQLIIKNSLGNGAAIRTTSTYAPRLGISSGKLTIYGGGSEALVDQVSLFSTKPIHRGILNGDSVLPSEWDDSAVNGTKLVLEYCNHDGATYEPSGSTQHEKHCEDCGFVGKPKNCGDDGINGSVSDGADGHYLECVCGNKTGSLLPHEFVSTPTQNGRYHTFACGACGYEEDAFPPESHVWGYDDITGKYTGICTECGFEPVAEDGSANLYDSVVKALEAVANAGGNENYVKLIMSDYRDGDTEIYETVVFNQPGKTVELKMNGHTLKNGGGATLEVEDGTLRITGDATIYQEGTFPDTSASAVVVSGGKLIFESDLVAHGGTVGSAMNIMAQKPAVYADGGELDFRGNLDLLGGLAITGNATLTQGLTQGTFRVDESVKSADRLSVKGSKNYKHLGLLLADNRAFVDNADNSQYRCTGTAFTSWSGDVTIVPHEHEWEPASNSGHTCECGTYEGHGPWEDGKCQKCGSPCLHTVTEIQPLPNGTAYCQVCGQYMDVKVENGGTLTYSKDFAAAMYAATDGTKITLLADVEIPNRTGISGDNTTVALDLNGHKITRGWLDVGDKDTNDTYTSCTLKIIGKGGFEAPANQGNICVALKATLDLSEWKGGTICDISMQDDSNYPAAEREAGLIVGPEAGTIGRLAFWNNQLGTITKIKLSGGSYEEIFAQKHLPIKLGDLLAEGHAFQKSDESYEEYTKTLQGESVSHVTVVPCTHEKVENGACTYCGKTGIAAIVDGAIYGDVEAAISAWMTNGTELTLYDNASISGATWNSSGKRILNLNGYALMDGKPDLKGDVDLTIRDASNKGRIDNLMVGYGSKLTLESGTIASLDVSRAADGDVKLRGGQVKLTTEVPIYKLLEEGCYLLSDDTLATPISRFATTATYRVKNAGILVAGTAKSGETASGDFKLPTEIRPTVFVNESNIAHVQFQWYLVKDDGQVAQLIKSSDLEPWGDPLAVVYDPNYTYGTEFANEGWKDLGVGETYHIMGMVTGKDENGNSLWHTALTGYTMTITSASLDSEKTVITQKAGTGNTGRPADNRLVVTPNVHGFDKVTYQFDVTYNGIRLELDKDYSIKENSNMAQDAGEHELTIVGKGNYTGEKSVKWTIEPYELSAEKHIPAQINKEYDGTAAADENINGIPSLGIFEIDSNNSRNPSLSGVKQINLHDNVNKTNLHFDSAEAGDRTFYFTLTLDHMKNFVFAGGAKSADFALSRKEPTDPAVSITQMTVAAPAAQELQVVNNLADSYTIDLPALPALPSEKMEYGEVSYAIGSVDLGSYYDAEKGEAKIENGKLILPIQVVPAEIEGSIGTVTVTASSTNVKDIPLTIRVSAINKRAPILSGELSLSKPELSYGEKLSAISISGTMTDPTDSAKTVAGKFEWVSPDETMNQVGDYQAKWKFVPEDADTYAEATGEATITVHKAALTGAPKYITITASGKKLSDAALAVNDSWPAGRVIWVDKEGVALPEDTEVKANTAYTWKFIPAEAENYNELSDSVILYSASTGGGHYGSTTTRTETVKNPDGSITKTETRTDGTVIKTTTRTDGSVSKTESKTTAKPDGSTVQTVTETNTNSDGSSSASRTETTTDANGVTTTRKTTTITAPDGSTNTTTTITDKNGSKTETVVKISEKAAEDAKKSGEAVKIPAEIKAGENSSSASSVKIELPNGAGKTKIEIPVKDVNSGTVAVIVHEDGTEEIVKDSNPTKDGVQLTVDGSATIKVIDNSKNFRDTRDHWSRDDVNFVASREIFNGVGNNLFGVGQLMTRGMVNTVLARLAGVDTTPKNDQKWYEVGNEWAKTNGISDGTNPEASVTREQLATLLYRFAGAPKVNGSLQFNDANQVSEYAQNALLWATQNGIMNGVGNECIAPNADAQRAQVAAMMARYLKNQ